MEITDRQTESCVCLKSPVRGEHDNTRRFERVISGEDEFTVIVATFDEVQGGREGGGRKETG